MGRVWAVCKDPGGVNNVLPVARHLRSHGHSVSLMPDGKATEILKRLGEPIIHGSAEALNSFFTPPDALVTSMCSGGGVGRDLVPLLREKGVPTVAVQDFWGARLKTDWFDLVWPDAICVNDPVGRDIVQAAWPEYPQPCIRITGYPSLDQYAGVDFGAKAIEVRAALGLKEGVPVVLFAGQLAGTAHALCELVDTLNTIGSEIYLIPRLHPRMIYNTREEGSALAALVRLRKHVQIVQSPDTATALAASTVVVSMYSTVLVEATVMRKDCIAVLYPDVGQARLKQETGGLLTAFPLAELGCCGCASDRAELTGFLHISFTGMLGIDLRLNQDQHFRLDGKNAARVADVIEEVMRR